jgi:hypothetical protein
MKCYERDSAQVVEDAKANGVVSIIPPRDDKQRNTKNNSNNNSHENTDNILRVAQWNVHYFQRVTPPYRNETHDTVLEELRSVNADVVVLNEFTMYSASDSDTQFLHRAQNELGYTHILVADTMYPTAILTRNTSSLPLVVDDAQPYMTQFSLDEFRSAVVLRLTLNDHRSCHQRKRQRRKRQIWIYGTHLHHQDDIPGRRTREMNALLEHVHDNAVKTNSADAVLIVGDFNEQRSQDYLPEEWTRIVANKEYRSSNRRGSSQKQKGASTTTTTTTESTNCHYVETSVDQVLTKAGFTCVWDLVRRCHGKEDNGQDAVVQPNTNWPYGQPPPSSHWTGTLIDYAHCYNSASTTSGNSTSDDVMDGTQPLLQNVGTYVSPCTASDHRLIVTDWKIVP